MATIFQGVADQHGRNGEQAEGSQGVHGLLGLRGLHHGPEGAFRALLSLVAFFACGLHMSSLLPATSPDRGSKPQRLGALPLPSKV
jgi:hypothetical protein